ncbi:MAG: AIR synthase family protein [Candidatus Binatia bacterium]|nr:AIR synthase family protein [Candidatus Binatia bacterium]
MARRAHRLLPGKLPKRALEGLLRYRGAADHRVVQGPAFGRDAAVVDLGERLLVLKSDPVTFVGEEAGWYAVHVNANDVAVVGCQPAWFQVTVLLPPVAGLDTARRIMRDVDDAARALGIAITGGHTEVTPAVTQPVVAGDMQGVARKDELVTPQGARLGDLLVCTKAAALEGTAILARSFPREATRLLGAAKARRATRFHRSPGISIVPEALLAARSGATAMHDPTEGGVRAGLTELALASGRGLEVDLDAIPVLAETRILCDHFGVDPLGLISSGMLLATVPPDHWPVLSAAWQRRGIAGQVIGRVVPGRGVRARQGGKRVRWHWSERDELARLLASTSTRTRPSRTSQPAARR